MKCPHCGAELTVDTKFCSYCGEPIETETPESTEENKASHNENSFNTKTSNEFPFDFPDLNSNQNVIKHKKDVISVLSIIALVLFGVMGLIALFTGRAIATVIAFIQIALIIVTIVFKKKFSNSRNKGLGTIAFVLSLVLIFPFLSLYNTGVSKPSGSGESSRSNEKFEWESIVLKDRLPKPSSEYGEINSNSSDRLSAYVYKFSANDFVSYIDLCKEKGYTVEAEETGDSFDAFSKDGYKLSLSYMEYSEEMKISLDEPIELSKVDWPDSSLSKKLPKPNFEKGLITEDSDELFSAYIEMSFDNFNKYVHKCEEKGFTVERDSEDKYYSAKNGAGNELEVSYYGNNVVEISIKEPIFKVNINIDCEENLVFSKYDVKVSIDGLYEETISHGGSESFEKELKAGNHKIEFESDEDCDVKGSIKIKVKGNDTFDITISCTSTKIKAKLDSSDDSDNKSISDNDDSDVEETTKEESKSETSKASSDNKSTVLTKKNCKDLANILQKKDPADESIEKFAKKYEGRTIEFDGNIVFCSKHGSYDTRFDYLLSAGDYNPNSQIGPQFKFEDVGHYNLNTDMDTVSEGSNVHIKAIVDHYDASSELFYLEPVSVTSR